jgi:hypothetical protein
LSDFLNFKSLSDCNLKYGKITETIKSMKEKEIFDKISLVNLLLWNIQCLNNKKFTTIKHYLDELSSKSVSESNPKRNFIDFLVLNETWHTNSNLFKLKNFNVFESKRETRKGGGILAYVHKSYHSVAVDSGGDKFVEYILIKIFFGKDEWHLLAVYRPPGAIINFIEWFENIVAHLDRSKLIVAGDININTRDPLNNDTITYNDTLLSLNMKVMNTAVTRENPVIKSNSSVIDHVLINETNTNHVSLTCSRINTMSDHNFLISLFSIDHSPKKTKRLITMKTYDAPAINQVIEFFSRDVVDPSSADVNSYFNLVHNIYLDSIANNTHSKVIKLPSSDNNLPTWANEKYIGMTKSLHNLEDKIEKLRNENKPVDKLMHSLADLDRIRHEYGATIAKKFYRRVELNNLSYAWKIINELAGRTKERGVIVLKVGENDIIVDESQIANAFQQKFLSIVGVKSPDTLTARHTYIGQRIASTFNFDEITPLTMSLFVNRLDNSKSKGFDNIGAKVWKGTCEFVCAHLANIFNLMVRTGVYPERLKKSIVIPIFKAGDPMIVDNYRPISILPLVDKVFESILYCQINRHLDEKKIHDKFQYGFRERKGCQEAIGMVLNHVSSALDKRKSVLIVSFDISKAFDTVNHEVLLNKMEHLGIRGVSNDLMRCFLNDRTQVVKTGESLSEEGKVLRGVPQGSNLGPLLFNLMINDLSKLPTYGQLYKFADDVVLVLTLEDNKRDFLINARRSSHDIKALYNYYANNDLCLNYKKSKFLVIGDLVDDELVMFLNESEIESCTELCHLGFIIDKELKLTSQINKLVRILAHGINSLMILKESVTRRALKQFYFAHIQSHIDYCAFALLRARAIDILRLQRLQIRALKIIFDPPDDISPESLFKNFAKTILPIRGSIFKSAFTFVYKCLHTKDGSLPTIQRLSSGRGPNLQLAVAKKKVLKDDPTHSGVKLFNNLPLAIRETVDTPRFLGEVKLHLIHHSEKLLSYESCKFFF